MPSLKSLMPETRTATIGLGRLFDHETDKVTYRPSLVSVANDVAADEDDDAERDWDAPSPVAKLLCELVVEWGLTGPVVNRRTGEELSPADAVVPLDPRLVQFLPYSILSAYLSGVTQNEMANPTRRRPKRNGQQN